MPSGKTHATASGVLAAVTAAAIFPRLLYNDPVGIVTLPVGVLSGILLSPDLDVDGGNISNAIIRRKVGTLAQWVWYAFWWPYSKVTTHRGTSHMPVIGTVLRVLYLLAPIFTVFYLVGWGSTVRVIMESNSFWWWFLGLTASDLLHEIMDAFF